MGIQVAPSALMVSHLLFVDDSLLLFRAIRDNLETVKNALDLYCRASRQHVNLEKSLIQFAKGCNNATLSEIKGVLQVFYEALSERYLGMSINVGSSVTSAFSYLKDRVWKKVQGWLEQSLWARGKEVLIKGVDQAISMYSMACFYIPRGLCKHIDIASYMTSRGQQRRKEEDMLGRMG
jgi:hypothetical protein